MKGYTEKEKDARRKYIGTPCTLQGKPALIQMNAEGFAVIRQVEAPHMSVEYAWATVWNVLDNRGGNFDDA